MRSIKNTLRATVLLLGLYPAVAARAGEPVGARSYALVSQPVKPLGFENPLVKSGIGCRPDAPKFESSDDGPPLWCPKSKLTTYEYLLSPAVVLAVHPDRSDVYVIDDVFLANINQHLASLETSWRASMMVGAGPGGGRWRSAPQKIPTSEEHWLWASGEDRAGLRSSAAVFRGRLTTRNRECDIVGSFTEGRFLRPCTVSIDSREAKLEMFPVLDPDHPTALWLATVSLSLSPPPNVVPPETAWATSLPFLVWAVTATAAWPLLFLLGKRVQKPLTSYPSTPLEHPPRPSSAERHAEAASETPIRQLPKTLNPHVQKQALLLDKLPHVRLAAHWIARDSSITSHESVITQLLRSSELAHGQAERKRLPEKYLKQWSTHAKELQHSRYQLNNLRLSLVQFFDNPKTVYHFAEETNDLWRELMPFSNERPKDKGAALAAQFRLDLLDLTVIPILQLSQLIFEALPREYPDIGSTFDPVDLANLVLHCTQVAEGLGYRYEHVPLYHSFDVDFVLDRDVTLVRASATEHLGFRSMEIESGTIFRVERPLLRPLRTELPKRRARFVIHREES